MKTRFWASLAIVFSISAYAGVSYAFPQHKFWGYAASGASGNSGVRPGGGGIFYTGGATDFGLKCSHCHIDNKKQQGGISLTVVPSPAWESVSGAEGYKPGQIYTITVNLVGEHLGDGKDQNGMTLTIENSSGKVAGVFEVDTGGKSDKAGCVAGTAADPLLNVVPTATQTTVILGDCHAVLGTQHAMSAAPRTSWKFKWTAPAAATGDVTIFAVGVDGDHPDVSSLDDDVAETSIVLKEGT